jgi:hypothetical protein
MQLNILNPIQWFALQLNRRREMSESFSGKVTFANGIAAPSVLVHVFEHNQPGQPDTDLTLTPTISDTGGHFSVTFNTPSQSVLSAGHLGGVLGSLFNPGTTSDDQTLPFLQFSYNLNLQDCTSTSPLAAFQTVFTLPEVLSLKMMPSVIGFKFINNFTGVPLPFSIPLLPGVSNIPSNYGLCGGMSSAAYDFFLAGRSIPANTDVPRTGTNLQRYLLKRSIDTFGPMGNTLVKVAQWTALPDGGTNGVQKQSYDEFQGIKKSLDASQAVIMALIYKSAATPAELLQTIWGNHQVLAVGYHGNFDGSTDIQIYDPNFPTRDDVFIHLAPVTVDGGLPGVNCTQTVGGQPFTTVRGILAMTYNPVEPPDGL